MYDRTVTSYIVLVDIAIFIRKRSKHNIKLVYNNIVLKETGAHQQQQGQQLVLEAHRDDWI